MNPNTRLGRATDNEIVLKDPQASRYHAIITLGSANGTWINGARLDQPRALRHGDVIVIGSEQLMFQSR